MDFPNIEAVYDHGITEADAAYLLENDVQIVEEELLKAHPCVADRLCTSTCTGRHGI